MKQALIDPTTSVNKITSWILELGTVNSYVPVYTTIANSSRVAEVVANGSTFPVATPFFWTDCADDVVADQWYYNTQTTEIIVIPAPPPYPTE